MNAPEMWIRAENAFEPIVSPELFFTARGIFQERSRRVSNEDMIAHLKRLGRAVPVLSARAIDADEAMPASAAYRSRFGSLLAAYRMAGIESPRDYRYVEINRTLRSLHPGLMSDLVQRLNGAGAGVSQDPTTGRLLINGEYTASIVLSRCRPTVAGSLRWAIRIDERVAPDVTILVRMDAENSRPVDYYLFPLMDLHAPRLLLCESNGCSLDTYQFDTLDYFAALARRRKLVEVA